MLKGLDSLFKNMDMSPEGIEKRRCKTYEENQENLENMSYWLPKIEKAVQSKGFLKIPDTKIVQLSFDQWNWLRSDSYKEEAIAKFNQEILSEMEDFLNKHKKLFMKTGIFSNKFTFSTTEITNVEEIGQKQLDMFYQSMLLGADSTAEVVFREKIESPKEIGTIYEGMPLNTEFRVFYDFSTKENIGISNYWNPEIMKKNLKDTDLEVFLENEKRIVNEYNQKKKEVLDLVKESLEGVSELEGAWSVDIMFVNDDFWLIDMARMNRSALVNQMEKL